MTAFESVHPTQRGCVPFSPICADYVPLVRDYFERKGKEISDNQHLLLYLVGGKELQLNLIIDGDEYSHLSAPQKSVFFDIAIDSFMDGLIGRALASDTVRYVWSVYTDGHFWIDVNASILRDVSSGDCILEYLHSLRSKELDPDSGISITLRKGPLEKGLRQFDGI